jgi:hypothetical protein
MAAQAVPPGLSAERSKPARRREADGQERTRAASTTDIWSDGRIDTDLD